MFTPIIKKITLSQLKCNREIIPETERVVATKVEEEMVRFSAGEEEGTMIKLISTVTMQRPQPRTRNMLPTSWVPIMVPAIQGSKRMRERN